MQNTKKINFGPRLALIIFLTLVSVWGLKKLIDAPMVQTWLRDQGYRVVDSGQSLLSVPGMLLKNRPRQSLTELKLHLSSKQYKKLIASSGSRAWLRGKADKAKAEFKIKRDFGQGRRSGGLLRLRLKGKKALMGMRVFSIRHPGSLDFQSDVLFLDHFRRESVLAPRVLFKPVSLNNQNLGLMAVEEHFSKELLESQRRREGLILKFDDLPLKGKGSETFEDKPLSAYGIKKVKKSKELKRDYRIARILMEAFQKGQISASEVFQPERVGAYLAVCLLWGDSRPLSLKNIRLYFDSATRRFEPIAYTGADRKIFSSHFFIKDYPLFRKMLEDPVVKAAFKKHVQRLSKEILDRSLENYLMARGKTYRKLLLEDFPLLASYPYQHFWNQARRILAAAENELVGSGPEFTPSAPLAAAAKKVLFPSPQVPGKGPWQIQEKNKELIISGKHRVRRTLLVPRDWKLILEPGTELEFFPKSGIVSRGAVHFKGTKAKPVKLSEALAGRGWSGIFVSEAADRSLLEYSWIAHTRGFKSAALRAEGGVTFYGCDVTLKDTRIEDCQIEDALNIVRGNFLLERVFIQNTLSDAFDSDFSQGSVIDSEFSNTGPGGDGIDLSGSEVSLERVRFDKVGDKAVSVGEKSHLKAKALRVSRSVSGVVSKDGSVSLVQNSHFRDMTLAAFMVYQKKEEYESASLDALKIEFVGSGQKAIVQKGGKMTLEGRDVPGRELDVNALYDSVMAK